MTTTIHGWPVIPTSTDNRLELFTVAHTGRTMRLRYDVGGYLVAFAARYHQRIAPLNVGVWDDWAWCPPRPGRASTLPSDHCAGVAMDLNATREGSQGSGSLTFWREPVHRLRLAKLLGTFKLLEWGGTYKHFRDPMHYTFKYGVTSANVAAEMKRLGIHGDGTMA